MNERPRQVQRTGRRSGPTVAPAWFASRMAGPAWVACCLLAWTAPADAQVDDFDGDGVADVQDNCPRIQNPGQEDRDGDGLGTACETLSKPELLFPTETTVSSRVTFVWGAAAPGELPIQRYEVQLSASLAFEQRLVDEEVPVSYSAQVSDASVGGQAGVGATFSSPSGGLITVSGLSGMGAADVGRIFRVSGASNSANRGRFNVHTVINSTSIKISHSSGAAEAGSIEWAIEDESSVHTSSSGAFMNVKLGDYVEYGHEIRRVTAITSGPGGANTKIYYEGQALRGSTPQTIRVASSGTYDAPYNVVLTEGDYFWRVRAVDADGPGPWGLRQVKRLDTDVRYRVQVATDTSFQSISYEKDDLPGQDGVSAHTMTAELRPATSYYWRVVAEDKAGLTRTSNTHQMSVRDVYGPVPSEIIYPQQDAALVNDAISFTWEKGFDESGIAQYRIQISDDASFSNMIFESTALNPCAGGTSEPCTRNGYETYHSVGNRLERGKNYVARVVSVDTGGYQTLGPPRGFSVTDRDPIYVVDIQDLQGRVYQSPELVRVTSHRTQTEIEAGKTYSWSVSATDAAGNTRVAGPRNFPLADIFPPKPAEGVFPLHASKSLSRRPRLIWEGDPTVAHFVVTVSESQSLDSPLYQVNVSPSSGKTHSYLVPSELDAGTGYYWRIRSVRGNGAYSDSDVFAFEVDARAADYTLEITNDGGTFTSVLYQATGIQATNYTLLETQEVPDGQPIHWRVQAEDGAGNVRTSNTWYFQLPDIYGPVPPILELPNSGAEIASDTPGFRWQAVTDKGVPAKYRFELSKSPDFVELVHVADNLSVPGLLLGTAQTLDRGATYYWRVFAIDNAGNRSSASADVFSVSSGEVEYTLTISKSSNLSSPIFQQPLLRTTSYTLDGAQALSEQVQFYWGVSASDRAGNVRASQVFDMYLEDQSPPLPPDLLYPIGGSEVLSAEPCFLWGPAEDSSTVTYTVQFSNEPDFSSLIGEAAGIPDSSRTYCVNGDLERERTIYWRVISTDVHGQSSTSDSSAFGIRSKKPHYQLEISASSGFGNLAREVEVSETRFELGQSEALDEGKWYWRVRAVDEAGNRRLSSESRTFELADIYPPVEVGMVFPRDFDVTLTQTPTVVWEDFQDNNGPITYGVRISDTASFDVVLVEETGLTSPSYQLRPDQALTPDVAYFVQISATDKFGNTGQGEVHRFRVAPVAVQYVLTIREQGSTSIVLQTGDLTPTRFSLSEQAISSLKDSVNYEWFVSARDGAGNNRLSAATFRFFIADVFPPTPPDLLYPADGVTMENNRISFLWGDVIDSSAPVTKILEVSEDNTFSDPFITETVAGNGYRSSVAQALPRGANYYWRLRLRDAIGNETATASSRFFVAKKDPIYSLEVFEGSETGPVAVSLTVEDSTSVTLSETNELTESKSYVWRVRAEDKAGNIRSAAQNFTFSLADQYPPVENAMLFPRDGDTVLSRLPALAWEPFRDTNLPLTYRIQISSSDSFENLVVDESGLTTNGYSMPSSALLERGQKYFYRIGATDAEGNSGFGTVHSFLVDPRAVQYQIDIVDKTTGQVVVKSSGITTTRFATDGLFAGMLREGVSYEWNILATDPAGNERNAVRAYTFQIADIFPPEAPQLVYPLDNDVVENDRVGFAWLTATDGTPPVSYRLQLSDDASFSNVLLDQDAGVANGYQLNTAQALVRGQTYYWRLVARDGAGNSSVSGARRFTLASKAPNYVLEIFKSSISGENVATIDTGSMTQHTLMAQSELQDSQAYVWRVRAQDKAGNEQVSSNIFRMELADTYPPMEVGMVFPLDGDFVLHEQPVIAWHPFVDTNAPLRYGIRLARSSDLSDVVAEAQDLNETSFAVPASAALQFGQTYYFRITAEDQFQNRGSSIVHSFTVQNRDVFYSLRVHETDTGRIAVESSALTETRFSLEERLLQELKDTVSYTWFVSAQDAAGNERDANASFVFRIADTYPPSPPDLEYPTEGALVENPRIGFRWSEVRDASPPVAQQIEISTTASFDDVVLQETVSSGTGFQLTESQVLSREQLYYWRLSLTDSLGNQRYTAPSYFTVAGKLPVYSIEVFENDTTGSPVLTSEIPGHTSFTVGVDKELKDSVPHYWRVRAVDKAGNVRPSNETWTFTLADRYAPVEVAMIFPMDEGMSLSQQPTIAWQPFVDSNGPISYRLQVSATASFDPLAFEVPNLTATSHQVTSAQRLERGVKYYVRIFATDQLGNEGAGEVHSFTVDAHQMLYTLNISESATQRLLMSTSELSSNRYDLGSGQTGELQDGASYKWMVTAFDPAGNSRAASQEFVFHITDIFPPTSPDLEYPQLGAEMVNDLIGFRWGDVSDATPPIRQRFELSDDSTFQTKLVVEDNVAGKGLALTQADRLTRGKTYFWRLVLTDALGNSAATNSSHFTVETKAPSYTIEVFENSVDETPVIQEEVLGLTSYAVTNASALEDSKDYVWRVKAKDRAGNEQNSVDTFRFQLADRYPPVETGMVFPTDGSLVLSDQPVVIWQPFIDTHGPPVYRLQIATDQTFESLLVDAVNLTEPQYQVPESHALPRGGTYHLRIYATDSIGNQGVGAAHSFTVDARALSYGIRVVEQGTGRSVLQSTGLTETKLETEGMISAQFTDGAAYRWAVDVTDPAGNYRQANAEFVFSISDIFPPDAPDYEYPLAGAAMENDEVGFRWSTVVDSSPPVAQTLQIAMEENFENIIRSVDVDSGHGTVLTEAQRLERGETYYWRLVLTDSLGNSATTSPSVFTVESREPIYTLKITEGSPTGVPVLEQPVTGATDYTLTAEQELQETVPYVWRVAAADKAGNSRESEARNLLLSDQYPPPLPELLYPAPSTRVISRSPGFVWESVFDPSGVHYDLEVSADENFGTLTFQVVDLEDAGWKATTGYELERGTDYYWRVRVRDDQGYEDVSPASRFTVDVPAVSYLLEVEKEGQVVPFALPEIRYELTGATQFDLSTLAGVELDEGGAYVWRVTATDGSRNSRVSNEVFKFNLADQFPPSPGKLVFPADGAGVINPTVGFSWEPSLDISSPIAYTLELLDQAENGQVLKQYPNLTSTSFSLPYTDRLPRGVDYYWRVRSRDSLGNESVSDVSNFNVQSKSLRYDLILAADESMTDVKMRYVNLFVPTFTVPESAGLDDDVPYFWDVKVTDGAGNETTAGNAPYRFQLADIYPPTEARLRYPKRAAVVLDPLPGFAWESFENPFETTHRFELSNTADFASVLHSHEGTGISGYQLPPSMELQRGLSYFWRVSSRDLNGNEIVGEPSAFGIARSAVRYDLQVARDNGFNDVVRDWSDLDVTRKVTPVEEAFPLNVDHYWRVRAVKTMTTGDESKNYRLEGETLAMSCGPVEENTETGEPGFLYLCSNGFAGSNFPLPAPGNYRIRFRAAADHAPNDGTLPDIAPLVQFRVANRTIEEVRLLETGWTVYETTTRLEGGNNQIGVAFVNDYYSEEKGDRNVRLDWVEVEGPLEAIENIRKEQVSETRRFNIRTLAGMVQGGLLATYFDDVELGGENPSEDEIKHRRIDGPIDFPLAADRDVYGDFSTGLGGDTFSVRWEGWVKADVTGEYVFYTTTNDGQRVWINGVQTVEDWNVQTGAPAEHTSTVTLTQGWNSIRFEMFDNLGPAFARLEYRPPGGTRQLVPANALGIMGDPNESQPPKIVDYYVSGAAPGFAALSVSTDELTQVTVEYGATQALGQSVTASGFQLRHVVKLPNPPSGALYYRVVAKDVAGNQAQSPIVTSCTPTESDVVEGQVRARYYSGRSFETFRMTYMHDRLYLVGPVLEVGRVLGTENFTVHVDAMLKADLNGSYNFQVRSVDGHRMVLGGETTANAWLPGTSNVSEFARTLAPGWHPLGIDLMRATSASGDWRAEVRVATPGQSLTQPPASRLASLSERFLAPQLPTTLPRLEVEAAAATGTAMLMTPPALLDCRDPHPTVVHNAPPVFPVGRTVVTWTATNRFDEKSVVQQEVVIRDTTPPTLEAGPDLTLGCDAPYGDGSTPTVRVQLNEPQVSDNGDPNPKITTDAPEYLPLGGPTTITVTATDASGNVATDSYDVTVIESNSITVNAGPSKLTIPEARTNQCDLGGGELGTPFPLRTPVIGGICNVAGSIDVAHFLRLAGETAYPSSGSDAASVCLRTGTNHLKWRAVVGTLEGIAELELEVIPTDFTVVVDSSPTGWTKQDGQLEAHLEGGFVAIDAAGALNMSWQVRADAQPTAKSYDEQGRFSATFTTEAIYCPVNLFVVDASGNVGASVDSCFGVDKTPPAHNLSVNHTWVAADDSNRTIPVKGDDLSTYPHHFTGEHMSLEFSAVEVNGLAQSGLTSVKIDLVPIRQDGNAGPALTMNEIILNPQGRPATGALVTRVSGCNAATLCENGPLSTRRLDLGQLERGHYRIDLRITDHAGNTALTQDYIRVVDFKDGLETAFNWVEGQLLNLSNIEAEDDLYGASTALETAARLHVTAPEHSLRLAQNAFSLMRRAELYNDEPTPFVQRYLPRGAKSEVRRIAEVYAGRGLSLWKPFDDSTEYAQSPYNKGEFAIDPVLRIQEAMNLVSEADTEWDDDRNGPALDKAVAALHRFALLYDNRVYADYFGDAPRYLDAPENSIPEATFRNGTIEDMGLHIAQTLFNRVDRVVDDPGIPDAARGPLERVKSRMETFVDTTAAVVDGTASDFEFLRDVYLNAQLALEELARVEAGSLSTEEWRGALSMVLSYAAHLSLYAEAESLARSPDTRDDRLVKVAQCRFQDFIHELSNNDIQAAVDIYKDSRCLIVAVYNEFYGGQSPANECVEPRDYNCPIRLSIGRTAGGCFRVDELSMSTPWTEEAACNQE